METNKYSRRKFVKKSTLAAGCAVAISHLGFNIIGKAKSPDNEIIGQGNFRYRVNKNWGTLDASKTPVFNCHEMVKDSKGRLIMINDDTRNNILIYDRSGKLLDSWGTSYPGGHGLTLVAEGGEDFLFIADCGYFLGKDNKWQAQSGSIVKTTTDGRLVYALGHRLP
jgi:hypothetical protein